MQIRRNSKFVLIAAPAVSLSLTVCLCSVQVVLIFVCKAFSVVECLKCCKFKETLEFKCILRLSIPFRTVLELGSFH